MAARKRRKADDVKPEQPPVTVHDRDPEGDGDKPAEAEGDE